jgi:hypothetical protein
MNINQSNETDNNPRVTYQTIQMVCELTDGVITNISVVPMPPVVIRTIKHIVLDD